MMLDDNHGSIEDRDQMAYGMRGVRGWVSSHTSRIICCLKPRTCPALLTHVILVRVACGFNTFAPHPEERGTR